MSGAFAQSLDDRYEFHIDGGALGPVMEEIHKNTGVQLLFSYDLVEFEGVNAVDGQYTVQEAMAILLHDTGLTSGLTESGMIVITRENSANAQNREDEMASGKIKKGLLASVAAFMFGAGAQAQDVESIDGTQENEEEKDVIVVTGTNIRGVSPDSSPSFVFDKEDIGKTGFGTVQEFVESLPQNFGGGANADFGGLPNDRTATQNQNFGSSVNLRGLGSGSTLVLLNGRRLAPAGGIGDFVDVSMIPLSAVERVEVLTDGASAIYGADAIAGVVNFVLRDDYDGAETFFRFGGVTEGDLNEYRAGQTLGKNWGTGNALISYEYYNRDSLGAEDRNFSSSTGLPTDLLQAQESHNFLATGSQELSERITLRGHGTYSRREGSGFNSSFSPTFFAEFTTEQYGVSAGADVKLWGDWLMDLSGGYHKVDEFRDVTGFSVQQAETDSELWSVDGKVDGSVLRLSGGDVKLAAGLGYREESFLFSDDPLAGAVTRQAERNVLGIFAEAFIPIVGADNMLPGVERLELTVAGRYDDYSDFGDTLNPKVGLLWSPFDGLNFRGTYSTSFNPPNLGDTGSTTSQAFAAFVPDPASMTGTSLIILDNRTNRLQLGPEQSTTWTAGFDSQWTAGPGSFDISLTWFDISYTDRIGSPGSFFGFLADPVVFADVIIANPDPAVTAALIADADFFFDFSGGGFTMPGDEDFILDGRLRNLAMADTSGLDINLAYSVNGNDVGQFDFGLNSTYLFKQNKQITANAPVFDVVSTVFNPVDLRLRGNASWSRNGVSITTYVNYVDSYVDDRNLAGTGDVRVDSWTTVDLNLSFDTEERTGNSWLDNTKFSLSVLNLFNEDPPSISTLSSFSPTGFDATNASPLGRFISFQVTKAW